MFKGVTNFLTVDNFLPDPDDFRGSALAQPFVNVRFADEIYRRVQVRDYDEHADLLRTALKRPVHQTHTINRLNFDGEMPNHAIHSDNDHGDFAAVLYLNKPAQCVGGTAFWRHKATGLTRFDPAEIKRAGKSPVRTLNVLSADWNDESKWEQTSLAEMKYNRLIVYSGRDFHSRWPFSAFGKTLHDGRFIWCSFFSC